MTREQFKARWESNDEGGGITFDDVADCAKAWGLFATPRICPIYKVRAAVLKAAGIIEPETCETCGGIVEKPSVTCPNCELG